jgi:membrane fusion protein
MAESAAASIESRAGRLAAERAARARYFELRMRSAAERVASLGRQITHAKAEADSLRQRAELAQATSRRYAALTGSGFVSSAQHQQRQEEALDAVSHLEAARRIAASLVSDRSAASTEVETLREQMQAELAEIDRSIESTREEAMQNATRKRLAVTAPADGIVSALKLLPGQAVQQGQHLFDFLPDAARGERSQVQLFATSRAVGFIRPGQQVNLRFDAFPFQKFGMVKASVASVSRTPYAPGEIPASVPAANEPMYRVLADIDAASQPEGPQLAFRPGMSVSADVLLETRAVWEWALEPLIAIHRKL